MAFGAPTFNIKDQFKGAGVTNDSTRDLTAPSVVKMSIEPVNEPFNSNNVLLLNTNSITESKSANWVKHYVPGQSDPLLQWISGSERTVTFTATVTKDLDSNPTVSRADDRAVWNLVIQPELDEQFRVADTYNSSRISALASVAAVGEVEAQNTQNALAFNPRSWSRSIQPQLDFYRSLVIPRDGSASSYAKTPPLVRLKMGTLLGSTDQVSKQKFILLTYQMTITEYSPQLEPMKATVSFTFVEYVPNSKTSTPQQAPQLPQSPKAPIIDNRGTISDFTRGVA